MVEAPLTLSVVVMAHPRREAQAKELAWTVGADRIVWDEGRGENDTGDRAWGAIDRRADWGLVLQDDAIAPMDLRYRFADGIATAPRTCIGLYVGTSYPMPHSHIDSAVRAAETIGASWLETVSLLWGVGVAMPTEHVDPMLAFVEHSALPYDRRLGRYFRDAGLPIRYTFPSLVDHRDGPTLLNPADGPRVLPRKAHAYGVPEWNERVVRF
ncbi:hypothetical protein [Puerhibacterium puerhi]|uniref:hypothetical protein n=1 Tax=Puerhibacterium puerhi TaxID=2692623 RepID=UPI00135B7484|nr:hypothetical protein [Puerhibacterium puerhi]